MIKDIYLKPEVYEKYRRGKNIDSDTINNLIKKYQNKKNRNQELHEVEDLITDLSKLELNKKLSNDDIKNLIERVDKAIKYLEEDYVKSNCRKIKRNITIDHTLMNKYSAREISIILNKFTK